MSLPAPSHELRFTRALGDGRTAHVVFTDRAAGSLQVDQDPDMLGPRRAAVVDAPWTWLRQVHGAALVVVEAAGDHAGTEADAIVTAATEAPVAVHTADCAPVALVADRGAIAVVHAGWRGLLAGVVEDAVAELRRTVGGDVAALLGPCIHAGCYEFSEADLLPLVARYGEVVRGRTDAGSTALDVPAAVEVALSRLGIALDRSAAPCTACDLRFFSHRARAEEGRQALVAWIEAS